VPAAVALFGPWNWWLPAPLARVLCTAPSPAALPNPGPA
jgi:putative drug exporter of the RND superfamily